MSSNMEHTLIYSKIRELLTPADVNRVQKNRVFYLALKDNCDVFVDYEVKASSELFTELSFVDKGSRIMTKVSLDRSTVMDKLFFDDCEKQFDILLVKFQSVLVDTERISAIDNKRTAALVTLSSRTAKDDFLNLATVILLSTIRQLLKRELEVVATCSSNLKIDDILNKAHFPVSLSSVKYLDCKDAQKDFGQFDNLLYVSTSARMKKCAVDNAYGVIYGNFTFKDVDGDDVDVLEIYLSSRKEELLKQAEERLLSCTGEYHSIEHVCEKMLPFILAFDIFSSPTPFNPLNPSPQHLRDAVFIHYNIARMAHIKQVYEKVEKHTLQTDLGSLSLDVEWALTCQLVNFEKIFEEAFISPFIKADCQANLCIHKLLQFLVKLVKLFSKYYSSTKIITYDQKESLIVRMNTRMLLVNSVYNVLVFCLKDILGVPLVLNM